MTTGRRVLLILLAFAVGAMLEGGCLLSPRDPDGPPSEDETEWETPAYTSAVLRNLKNALEGESIGNYKDCFTEDFRFHVDPSDSLDAGQEAEERYANWTLSDEETYVQNIFPRAESISLTLTEVEDDFPPEGDDIYRKDDYELVIVWKTGDLTEEVVYKGQVTLHMRYRDTGTWAIYKWVDRRTEYPEYDTWGVLRGDNRG
ncbi:MAG: hypothetical protein GF405_02815 [Candidatus Eisenbacteria bacterium]|nr:hypothetical protein [Candidatus Eisenbacteria bacterium]